MIHVKNNEAITLTTRILSRTR